MSTNGKQKLLTGRVKKQKTHKKKKSQPQRRGNSRQFRLPLVSAPSGGGSLLQQYYRALCDPFNYTPPALGFGTTCNTTIVTAYLRITQNVFTDGTGTFLCGTVTGATANSTVFPWSFLNSYLGGGGATTNTGSGSTNSSNINGLYGEARWIAGGLKAIPSMAMTAASGICYTGELPIQNLADSQNETPNSFLAAPFSKVGTGYYGGYATSRPVSISGAASFTGTVANTDPATQSPASNDLGPIMGHCLPYVGFTGIGISTPVMVEVIGHIEAMVRYRASVAPVQSGVRTGSTLADHFPSYDAVVRVVTPRLPPASRPALPAGDGGQTNSVLTGLMSGVNEQGQELASYLNARRGAFNSISGILGPL